MKFLKFLPRSPLPPFKNAGTKGSAIVSVLIIVVFLGIVTASMLRNTGSQTAVSKSFSTVMTANMSVNSGFVATESFFERAGNDSVVLLKLNAVKENKNDEQGYIYGKNKREEIGNSSQYFRSRLVDVKNNSGEIYAYFDVDGGNNPNTSRKGLREAQAFYHVENVGMEQAGAFGGMNAFYAGNNITTNANMRIEGHATFSGKFETNTGANIVFAKDALGRGDVFFQKPVTFNVAAGSAGVTFESKAYFNDDVRIELTQTAQVLNGAFQDDVGFRKHFDPGNGRVDFGNGDVWFNEGLRNIHSPWSYTAAGNGQRISGTGTFYHTNRFNQYTQNNPSLLTNVLPVGAACCSGPSCIHNVAPNQHIDCSPTTNRKVDFDDKQLLSSLDSAAILTDKLNMRHYSERQEPDVSLDVLLTDDNKEFLTMNQVLALSSPPTSTQISASVLERAIAKASPQNFDENGHLLINVNNSTGFKNDGTEFNGKVIFHVNSASGLNVNNEFYNSGPDASTLIYVGPNGGALNNMGGAGLFRGLIYVHENNTANHTFKWGADGDIEGAVIMKGGILNAWNSGSGAAIRRDDEVLKNFGYLTGSESAGEGANIVKKGTGSIKLKMLGVYYR
jgi:hypothetical protein